MSQLPPDAPGPAGGSMFPPPKPSPLKPRAAVTGRSRLRTYFWIACAFVLFSPCWLPVLLIGGCIVQTHRWEASLPEMPAQFQGRPFSHWLKQADDPDPGRRREALDMLTGMLVFACEHDRAMNCGGGFVWEEDRVYKGRIRRAVETQAPSVLRILERDCVAEDRELKLAALRGIATLPRLKKHDKIEAAYPDSIGLTAKFLPYATCAYRDHPEDEELRAAAVDSLATFNLSQYGRQNEEEIVPILLAALDNEKRQVVVVQQFSGLSLQANQAAIDRLKAIAATAESNQEYYKHENALQRIREIQRWSPVQ